jgi:hypothetical protein
MKFIDLMMYRAVTTPYINNYMTIRLHEAVDYLNLNHNASNFGAIVKYIP